VQPLAETARAAMTGARRDARTFRVEERGTTDLPL
jgi:hypothetical protein